MPLDRNAHRLLRMLAAAGAAGPPSLATRRRALQALTGMAEKTPAGAVAVQDLAIPGPAGPIAARLHHAAGRNLGGDGAGAAALWPGLVYFHGGGWVAGDLDTHDDVCRRLALASGAKVLSVDYRLAPEHPFPAAYDDAVAATVWTATHAEALGIDPLRLGVAGDSAGGGLAAAVAQRRNGPPLALQVLVCPILNLAEATESRRLFAKGYFVDAEVVAADVADYAGPDADLRDPRLSPGLASDLAGLPPAIVETAEFDPFRDEGEAYAARLEAAGVAVRRTRHDGMIHYFYALPGPIPYAGSALAELGRRIGEALARPR